MSKRPLQFRPEAREELVEARDWYDRQRDGLGIEFLTAVNNRLADIEKAPFHFAAGYHGVRIAGVDRFPYFIYFMEIGDCIEVIAIHHGSRSPSEWRRRARK